MDLSKKVWLLNFCEGTLDGLVRCYLHDSTQGYRLLWGAVGDVKAHPALEKPGIYFVVEKKSGNGKPHIYVGQATERKNKNGMLNRLKEHRRKGEFTWADDVVFLPTPEKFGSTELNFLENRFYSLVVEAGSYEAQNAIDPHRSKPRDEIMWVVESFVEDAESILAIFGHRPFLKVEDSVESSELPKPAKAYKERRKPKQPLSPLPEIPKVVISTPPFRCGETPHLRRGGVLASPKQRGFINTSKVKTKGGKQPNFSFAAVGVPVGAELQFMEAPITVTVVDEKNKVTYQGKPYSLSGFVKAFHPHPNGSGAYQGPKFFTYKGVALTDLRGTVSNDGSSDSFVCASRGVTASGKIVRDGFVVLKGSQMALEPTTSFPTFAKAYELWKQLQKDGTVVNGIFACDCHFSAASTAAAVVIAGTANGNKMWKCGKKTLGDCLKEAR